MRASIPRSRGPARGRAGRVRRDRRSRPAAANRRIAQRRGRVLLRPAAGSGEDLRSLRCPGLNRHAGYLFQADALFPWKTAIDNVAIGLEITGARACARRKSCAQKLAHLGGRPWRVRQPLSARILSGGQRKRVGLAQVLIRDPKILLMDEPFGPLDAQTRQIMGNLLLELWSADRKAVLFVTTIWRRRSRSLTAW